MRKTWSTDMENDPLISTQLGAYFIQSKLGEGGMAQVYKAYHARLHREVAIKVILPQVADTSGFRERFEREAQLIASLEHRNIVAVYDFGELGKLTYLVMQYVGGGTLRDLLRREGKIEPQRAIQYAIQMSRALHHAHQRGIVHRDVKPQNMLISASDPNELLLSDFGIAKLFDSGSSQETIVTLAPGNANKDLSLTSVDQMVGTAEYMAPEQINKQAVDARTDVYAMGIVLFQMLTGQVPFSSTTIQGLLFQHVYTPPRPIREINPSISPALEQIILQALAKAPAHRYQSAEAMAQALERAAPLSTHPHSTPSTTNYASYGQSSVDPVTHLSQPSPARSYYGQQSFPGMAPTNQPLTPTSQAGSGSMAAPMRAQPKRKLRFTYLLYSGILLVSLVLLSSTVLQPTLCNNHLFCLSPSQSSPLSSGMATAFNENFHNNDRNWTIGELDSGNLTASISSNEQYTLSIGNASNTYFPNPSAVGTLPDNFALSAQIAQSRGVSNVFYGLAFHLRQVGGKVYSYAFVVNGNGDYEVLKYNADVSSSPSILWQGQESSIHARQANTLQVTEHGNTFSFSINNAVVTINGPNQASDNAQPYTGGQPGLLVAGPGTTFIVTSVTLSTS